MAQFDIARNADARTRERTPYLIDLQADAVSILPTRVVVPVRRAADMPAALVSRLHLPLEIDAVPHVAFVSELSSVPSALLGPAVGSAREHRTELVAAVDLLVTGF